MPKVKKSAFDIDLQKLVGPLRILSYLISKPWGVKMLHSSSYFTKGQRIKDLRNEECYIPSRNDGPDIRIRIFRPDTEEILPALLYIHGGGYLIGIPEISLNVIEQYIKRRKCVVVAVDYRKGLKHGYPDGFNDCYDTLLWMKENAESLNIRSDKFVVGGHSAGGGLTAAVTLKACDKGDVNLAFQMPIYPMIDCRQNTESAKAMDKGVPTWNAKSNKLGWKTYLQNIEGEIPTYASPALSTKFNHLPPTITFVGELEPFKDETITYVESLKSAGVPVKFELFEKAYHAFETTDSKADVSKRANRFQYEAWEQFYDKYL
ncbi:MAG: alpha/beta hydrolase [Cyclobacteriaceae bacterium]